LQGYFLWWLKLGLDFTMASSSHQPPMNFAEERHRSWARGTPKAQTPASNLPFTTSLASFSHSFL
jgi:hypothetical protein